MVSPTGEKPVGRGHKIHQHWNKISTQKAGEIFRDIIFEEDGESLRMENVKLILEDKDGMIRPEVRDMIIESHLG